MIEEILSNLNKKQYRPKSLKTEVVSLVVESAIDLRVEPDSSEMIANRLLNKEIERQKEVDRLNIELKKGSLIQSLLKDGDYLYYIITKIENVDILDIDIMFKRSGLPYENKSFKNCLFKIEESGDVCDIFLSDKNGPIADYWDNLFLELEEVTSDENNTLQTYNYLTHKIKKEIEKESPSDYTLLRNQVLGFFMTQEEFNLEDFFNFTFGSYQPENPEIDIQKIKESITDQLSAKKFDTEFNIVPSAIKSRKTKETKKVNDCISITLDGFDQEIKNNIKTREEHGEKFIMIKSTEEKTYDKFNWGK